MPMTKTDGSNFSNEERLHYSRQITMPKFGLDGQMRLKNSKIAVIGAGGLGAPILQYLSAAGVGTIGIFDFDHIEKSNLHRQVLFNHSDVGEHKAATAAKRLRKQNPHIEVTAHNEKITPVNAVRLLKPYQQVVDGSDNFLTRYVINNACLSLDIPLVYGSVFRFEGQVTVFNYVDKHGNRGPNLYDLYPEVPDEDFIPNCSEAGVLGVLPGVIGSLQAAESIKIATGIGDILSGKLLVMDLLHSDVQKITFFEPSSERTIDHQTVQERLHKLANLVEHRNENAHKNNSAEITAENVSKALTSGKEIDLIDVRTAEEHETFNLGGRSVPLKEIETGSVNLSQEKTTVFYCQTGKRSAKAIQSLLSQNTKGDFLSLKGGVDDWIKRIRE